MVDYICPMCQTVVEAAPSLRGKEAACPECGRTVQWFPAPAQKSAPPRALPPIPPPEELAYLGGAALAGCVLGYVLLQSDTLASVLAFMAGGLILSPLWLYWLVRYFLRLGRAASARGDWKPLRSRFNGAIAVTALALAGASYLLYLGLKEPPMVRATLGEWLVTCNLEKPGPSTATEQFVPREVEAQRLKGQRVDRLYFGKRVWVDLDVGKNEAGLAPGRYRAYGNVFEIDVANQKLLLTECRLVPR